jgi:hypothetical protein
MKKEMTGIQDQNTFEFLPHNSTPPADYQHAPL